MLYRFCCISAALIFICHNAHRPLNILFSPCDILTLPLHPCLLSMTPLSIVCDLTIFALQALESFYEKFDPDFIDIRTKAREVLQREDDLNEIVQVLFCAFVDHLLAWNFMMSESKM